MTFTLLVLFAVGFGIYAGFSIYRKEQNVVLVREVEDHLKRAACSR